MIDLHHNIVNILYLIKEMSGSHLAQAREEGRFVSEGERLCHAECVLEKIAAQAERALAVTRRLGEIMKGEGAERKGKARHKASLPFVWRRVKRLLAEECSLSGFEILERIPERFPVIDCDRDALAEILFHLAKNALQAMRPSDQKPVASPLNDSVHSRLILRAALSFSTQEEPVALITLSDTGPGIPEECLAKLFSPFYTTKPEGVGNGLGLYLTRELVLKNKGQIKVSSFPGQGTSFTLEFGIQKAEGKKSERRTAIR